MNTERPALPIPVFSAGEDDALRQRDALLRAVARFSSLLLGVPDFSAVLPDGFRAIGEAAGIHRVVLFLQHARAAGAMIHRVEAEWCAPGIRNHAELGQEEIANQDGSPFVDELHRGRGVWSVVEYLDEPLRDFCKRLGIVSVGCVPVLADGNYIGLIAFDDCVAPRTWRAEIDALTTAANAIGAAVERREAERRRTEAVAREREQAARQHAAALERANALLRAVAAASHALLLDPDIEGALASSARMLGESGALRRVSILPFDSGKNAWSHKRKWDWPRSVPARSRAAPAVRQFPAADYPSLSADHRAGNVHDRLGETGSGIDGSPFADALTFPISLSNRYWGAISFGRLPAAPAWSVGEIAALESAAAAIASAVERKETADALQREARARIRMEADRENAVLAERNRIARDIHDNLAQAFTAASLQLQAIRMKVKDAGRGVAENLAQAERSIRLGLAEARQSVMRLSPPEVENAGLPSVLQDLVDRSSVPGLLACRLSVRGGERRVAPGKVETALRVAQESIQNAIRHSQARNVLVTLECLGPEMLLRIDDDGVGMTSPVAPGSLGRGLRFMHQRASECGGSLRLGGSEMGGVRVELRMPSDP